MRRRQRIVGFLWRWHRRLGLAAAALVLVLSVTGIALNHTEGLGLDQRFVNAGLLRQLYGVAPHAGTAFRVNSRWLSRSPAGELYLDTQAVAPCRGALVGAAFLDEVIYAACAQELVLITAQGELLESLGSASGVPVPLTGLVIAGDAIALGAAGRWHLADLDALRFDTPPEQDAAILQAVPVELPDAIRAQIPQGPQWLTWERVLLDLHSGRLGGPLGVWLVDALGVVLSLLAVSGFVIWWLRRRRHHTPS
ncbi:PepSY domain-containing protein [Mangrovimicrobium sediminis]|uniref:PepSY domain-containing protein n=1 Tax=Mangrovimicrobium sediminis TaxID=2562682 RepID=A0A4Z0LY16_9GAMM|nr:PepSY-associated TM helix domain-containing protein [Haliea sp. SAOS-164]TGD72140.1 PepSY domain-containing protein [Haliea sp. SAOS-164]